VGEAAVHRERHQQRRKRDEVPTLKAIKSIKVGRYPWGVAIKP
jgi:hypothetical protein